MLKAYLGNFSITAKVIFFLTVISMLLVTTFFGVYKKQLGDFDNYNQAAITAVASMFKLVVNDYLVTGDNEGIEKNVKNSIREGLIFGIAVYSNSGELKLTYPETIDLSLPAVEISLDSDLENHFGRSYFKIFINHSLIENARTQFKRSAIIFIVVLISALIVIAVFLNRSLVRPLLGLSSTAKRISEGNYNFVAKNCQKDEIGVLTGALSEMAESLNSRSIKDALHLREVVKAHGEIAMENQDRTRYLDSILSNTTPHLTEALVTLQSLTDRPIQHRMLNKIILFVMAQMEQARGMLEANDSLFKLDLEKVTVAEFAKVVKEYAFFFSTHKETKIDFSFKCDTSFNLEGVHLVIDKKLLIKLFSLIFEIINTKGNSYRSNKSSVSLILDEIREDVATIDIIVRSDNSWIGSKDCVFINNYFASVEILENESEEFRQSVKFNKLVFTGLKAIVNTLKAQFHVGYIGDTLESRFHCKVLSCDKLESLDARMARYYSLHNENQVILVGDKKRLFKMNSYQHIISVVDFRTFLADCYDVNQESHYVIDFISDNIEAKKSASKLKLQGLKNKNFVLLADEKNKADNFIDYSYEVGADLIITSSINPDNIEQIISLKRSEKIKDSISQLFVSIMTDHSGQK